MIKSFGFIALTVASISLLSTDAPARPISVPDAQNSCNGIWVKTSPGVIVCAWCEKGRQGKSVCHWIGCDETGCDRVDIAERKLAPAPLRRPPRADVSPRGPDVFGGNMFWR